MQLPNGWEFAALCLACARVGAVVNPLVPIFRHRELSFILERTRARVCVVPATFRGFAHGELLAQLAREVPTLEHAFVLGAGSLLDAADAVDAVDAPCRRFEEHFLERRWEDRAGLQAELDRRRPHGDDLAEIQFTSGTTGEPKGVQHTWNTAWSAARAFPEILGFGPDDVAFMASTVAHQTGFLYGFGCPMLLGLKVVFQEVWDPAAFVRIVDDEAVTYTVGATPFVMDAVAAQRDADPKPSLATFRWFGCGGAPIPPHLVAAAREVLDVQLVAVWGMTENGVVTCTRPDDPVEVVADSDGIAIDWMDVRIVAPDDPDGKAGELAPGEIGLLQARGASQTIGYFQRPDLYEASLHRADDGGADWFDTGDLAWRRPADGGIRIAGRAKDLIIRGGENVPVVEVEAVLYTHPKVQECAVVGIPDDRLGERACAVVVAAPPTGDAGPTAEAGATPSLTLAELVAHCDAAGMARQFWPERLELVDEMPKTPSGKIQKFLLRQRLTGQA
jgi:cyclohexanecarboxylate-CoA ligase